jgi:Fe-S oxidoreductase
VALWVLVVGLLGTVVALAITGRRVLYLFRLITSGQPAPDRVVGVTRRLGRAIATQVVEVLGQKKLLKWSVPGAAHFFVFWAFLILGTVYLEAYGILLSRNPDWAIPVIGHWDVLGFAQDLIALLALAGIITFALIRAKESPERLGRRSRFAGSHTGGAWLVLFMIFNVLWTMFFFRGAAAAADNFPYGNGAFVSQAVGKLFDGFSHDRLEILEGVGLLLHIGIMLVFLVDVVHSKHLHIFVAPLNVLFSRRPQALGAVKPLMNDGKPVTLDDIDDLDEDAKLGVGSIEDFSWKGLLDMATCTECGRCQSQCPAWNTEKPLSPKMLMLNLRDHAFASGPAILAGDKGTDGLPESVIKERERPLVGETEGPAWDPTGGGVIDPDVLWSCVTCGACVNQCPVDIEHVDHIIDMRRYQVLVESNFPAELNGLFKGLENKGNPWNLSASARMEWAKDLPFEVKVVGETIESLEEVDWLFWVGCAGAYEDRAKKTTRAVAELLDMAGVSFGVLGNGETCTGDSARRAGNEFLFQGLAQQNVETFKEYKVKKVVSTCAHCFNTLKNEYQDFGIELEVVHHTQLLNRLVRDGKLTPVKDGEGAHKRSITYHDPCYIGRHNGVYEPPRELLEVLPGASYVEMERNSERSFCCGAGGARMWMEETIGTRINNARTAEAVGTGADQIAVGCPFCRVMLDDGLTAAQANGEAREEVEVLDVAQMLLASVKGRVATKRKPGEGGAAPAPAAKASPDEPGGGEKPADEATVKKAADVGPAAKASGGSSLFDTPAESETAAKDKAPAEEAKAAKPASSGGSLFDVGGADDKAEAEKKPEAKATPASSGGSLFDVGGADDKAEAEKKPEAKATPAPSGGSLFDIKAEEPKPAEPAAKAEPEPEAKDEAAEEPKAETPVAASSISETGSLFDIAAPEAPAAEAKAEPEPEPEAKDEPADGPDPEANEKEEEKPKPASGAEAHQPKTDADIGEASSLFDL